MISSQIYIISVDPRVDAERELFESTLEDLKRDGYIIDKGSTTLWTARKEKSLNVSLVKSTEVDPK